MRVTKAIIPAAGHGTRMRPVTLAVPKELLPVGTRPAIHFTLEEAASAGLREVTIVINRDKELIRRYVELLGDTDPLRSLAVEFVYQDPPAGLGDAISLCRDLAADQPFALLMPDNVPLAPDYRLTSLIEVFEDVRRDVLGILELSDADSGLYGNSGRVEYDVVRPGVLEIRQIHPKGEGTLGLSPGETILRGSGRWVCHPHIFEYIDRLRPRAGAGEFDDVPVFQRIVSEKGAVGIVLPAPVFDIGNPRGYLSACAHLHAQGS